MARDRLTWAVGLVLLTVLLSVGWSARAPGCPAVKEGVNVCVNGHPVAWSAAAIPPHMHEIHGYYAFVGDLADALGVEFQAALDQQSVRVAGRPVTARTGDARGVHKHDELLYVPVREFAEAAGFRVEVDTRRHTVNIRR